MSFPRYIVDMFNKYKALCNEAEIIKARIEDEVSIHNAESGRDRELCYDSAKDWELLEDYAEQLRKNF